MLSFTDEEIFDTLSDLRGLPVKEIRQEYEDKPEKLIKLRKSYSRLFADLISFTVGTCNTNSNSNSSIAEPL